LRDPRIASTAARAVERFSETTLLEEQLVHLAVLPPRVEAHVHIQLRMKSRPSSRPPVKLTGTSSGA